MEDNVESSVDRSAEGQAPKSSGKDDSVMDIPEINLVTSMDSKDLENKLLGALESLGVRHDIIEASRDFKNEAKKIRIISVLERIGEIVEHVKDKISSPIVFFTLGHINIALERFSQGLVYLGIAEKMGMQSSALYSLMGYCYYMQHDHAQARKYIEKAIDIDEHDGLAWYIKAKLDEMNGDFHAAMSGYTLATRFMPKNATVWITAGKLNEDLGKDREAMRAYERAVKIAPERSDVWYLLGNIQYLSGNLQDALKNTKKAVELNSDDADGWRLLGNIYEDMGRSDEALLCYDKAAELEPEGENLVEKGEIYLSKGEYEKAEEIFRQVLESDSEDEGALRGMVESLAAQKRLEDATVYLDKLMEINPRSSDNRLLKGCMTYYHGLFEEAEDMIQSVIREDRYNAKAHFILGKMLMARMELRKARESFETAVELNPTMENAQSLIKILGYIISETEDIDKNLFDEYYNIKETLKNIQNSEAMIDNMESAGVNVDRIKKYLNEARNWLIRENYKMALSYSLQTYDELRSKVENELSNLYNSARRLFDEFDTMGIKSTVSKDWLDDFKKKMDNGNISDASTELVEFLSVMKKTRADFEKARESMEAYNSEIRTMKQLNIDTSELETMMQNARTEFQGGNYVNALSVLDVIDEKLKSLRKVNQELLDISIFIDKAIKEIQEAGMDFTELERASALMKKHLNSSDLDNALKEGRRAKELAEGFLRDIKKQKIAEALDQAAELIFEVKGLGGDVSESEEKLRAANSALEEGDLDLATRLKKETIDAVIKAKDNLSKEEAKRILESANEIIDNIKTLGSDVSDLTSMIMEATEDIAKGEYLAAKEKSITARRMARDKLKSYSREIAQKLISDAQDIITTIFKEGGSKENIQAVNATLEKAKSALEYGDYTTAEELATSANNSLQNVLNKLRRNKLNNTMKRIMSLRLALVKSKVETTPYDEKIKLINELEEKGDLLAAIDRSEALKKEIKTAAKRHVKTLAEERFERTQEAIDNVKDAIPDGEKKNTILKALLEMRESAKEAIKYGDFENALYYSEEILDKSKLAIEEEKKSRLRERIIHYRTEVSQLEKEGMDIKFFREDINKIEELVKAKKLQEASELLEKSKEHFFKSKSRFLKKHLQQSIAEATPILQELEGKGINTDEINDRLNEGMTLFSAGDVTGGAKMVKDALEELRVARKKVTAMELEDQLQEARKEYSEIKSQNQEILVVQATLDKAEAFLKKEDFNAARDLIRQAKITMQEKAKEFYGRKMSAKIKDARAMLEELRSMGIDINIGMNLIKEAETAYTDYDFETVKELIGRVNKFAGDVLESHQKGKTREALNNLSTEISSSMDSGIRCEEAEALKKKAQTEFENGEYVKAMEHIQKANKFLEKSKIQYFRRSAAQYLGKIGKDMKLYSIMGVPEEEQTVLKEKIKGLEDQLSDEEGTFGSTAIQRNLFSLKMESLKLKENIMSSRTNMLIDKIEKELSDMLSDHMDDSYKDSAQKTIGYIDNARDALTSGNGTLGYYWAYKANRETKVLSTLILMTHIEEDITSLEEQNAYLRSEGMDTSEFDLKLSELRKELSIDPYMMENWGRIEDTYQKVKEANKAIGARAISLRTSKAKEAISSARDIINELKDMGIDVKDGERNLIEAEAKLNDISTDTDVIQTMHKTIEAMELADKASELAFNALKVHQKKSAEEAFERAQKSIDELAAFGVDVSKLKKELEEATAVLAENDLINARALAEQVREKASLKMKNILIEKAKDTMLSAEHLAEEWKDRPEWGELNEIVQKMKDFYYSEEFAEVITLGLRFKKTLNEINRKYRTEKFIMELEEMHQQLNELIANGDDVSTWMELLNKAKTYVSEGHLEDAEPIMEKIRAGVAPYITKKKLAAARNLLDTCETEAKKIEIGDKDNSRFSGKIDKIKRELSPEHLDEIMPELKALLTNIYTEKYSYLKSKLNEINTTITKMKLPIDETTRLEREARLLYNVGKIEDAGKVLEHAIELGNLSINKKMTDEVNSNINSLQRFVDIYGMKSEYADIVNVISNYLKQIEELTGNGDLNRAFEVSQEAIEKKETLESEIREKMLLAELNRIKEEISRLNSEEAIKDIEQFNARLSDATRLIGSKELDKAKSLIQDLNDTLLHIVQARKAARISAMKEFIQDTLNYYGALIPEVEKMKIDFTAKFNAMKDVDMEKLYELYDEMNNIVKYHVASRLAAGVDEIIQNYEKLVILYDEFRNYIDDMSVLDEAYQSSEHCIERSKDMMAKSQEDLAYYWALKGKSELYNSLNGMALQIIDEHIRTLTHDLKIAQKQGINTDDVMSLYKTGLRRKEMGDYLNAVKMFYEARSRINEVLRKYYAKSTAYSMLSLDNTIRDLKAKSINVDELMELRNKASKAIEEENWLEAEKLIRACNRLSRDLWNQKERERLQPFIDELSASITELKKEGADVTEAEESFKELSDAVVTGRMDDAKNLIQKVDSDLTMAKRRFENVIAKNRYLRKKAEEALELVKNESKKLDGIGEEPEQLNDCIQLAEEALQEGNYARAAQEAVRARQMLSEINAQLEIEISKEAINKLTRTIEVGTELGIDMDIYKKMQADIKMLQISGDNIGAREMANRGTRSAIAEITGHIKRRVENYISRLEDMKETYNSIGIDITISDELKNMISELERQMSEGNVDSIGPLMGHIETLYDKEYSEIIRRVGHYALEKYSELEDTVREDFGSDPQAFKEFTNMLEDAYDKLNNNDPAGCNNILIKLEHKIDERKHNSPQKVSDLDKKMAIEAYDLLTKADKIYQALPRDAINPQTLARIDMEMENSKDSFQEEKWAQVVRSANEVMKLMAKYSNAEQLHNDGQTDSGEIVSINLDEIQELEVLVNTLKPHGIDTTSAEDLLAMWHDESSQEMSRERLDWFKKVAHQRMDELETLATMIDATLVSMIDKAQENLKAAKSALESAYASGADPARIQNAASLIEEGEKALENGDAMLANKKAVQAQDILNSL